MWGTKEYPGLKNRLLYTSVALRDARGKIDIGGVAVWVEVARRHVKGKALTSVLKLVEENMSAAATKGAQAADTAGEPNTAKTVVDKEGPPLRKKRHLRQWPFGPENGEKLSEATLSWKSTWSEKEVDPINTKPTETGRKEKERPKGNVLPPSQPTQVPRASQPRWGPESIENVYEHAV
jgi:hypothetical protein